ncbi:MAG TPA: shikimate dehydrogenase [Solirubrobacteraceae bacterium]|nr:shikimate dehydrogenase [Solirubrobacteraceae bacterium]
MPVNAGHRPGRLGVIGWPVFHSRSPAMQNAALAALGLEGFTYQHLPAPPELFPEILRALPAAGFVGANVTVPHKHVALAMADSTTEAVRAIGAANSLSFGEDGTIHADNTDAPGMIDAIGRDLQGTTAMILGAGGTARAAAWALREAGSEVFIWNRTPERAAKLAQDLDVQMVAQPLRATILINTTTVGMDESTSTANALRSFGLDSDALDSYEQVVDFVYSSRPTALVTEARRRGVATVDGLQILVTQGALSLHQWTGRVAPLQVMRAAAEGGGNG